MLIYMVMVMDDLFCLALLINLLLGEQKKSMSGTERIEEDLARARAAIREAIRAQNCTSDKEEIYVPTGSVYRNAYAFHQLSTVPPWMTFLLKQNKSFQAFASRSKRTYLKCSKHCPILFVGF
jgi:hypothetical protein